MQYRALADYIAKARLRRLIGEYGDFRILILISGHYLQTTTHEMKDARKREVDLSVQPK